MLSSVSGLLWRNSIYSSLSSGLTLVSRVWTQRLESTECQERSEKTETRVGWVHSFLLASLHLSSSLLLLHWWTCFSGTLSSRSLPRLAHLPVYPPSMTRLLIPPTISLKSCVPEHPGDRCMRRTGKGIDEKTLTLWRSVTPHSFFVYKSETFFWR